MNKEKRKKIITKTFNDLYNAFYYLYQYKKDDILYNGHDGTEETSIDCFGHYFEYNGRRYAADVGYPGEFCYAYSGIKKNRYGVYVYRFVSGEDFAHDNEDAAISFLFDRKTEKLIEILDLERIGKDWRLDVDGAICKKYISKNQIKIDENGSFEYITEGFHIERNEAYLDKFDFDDEIPIF